MSDKPTSRGNKVRLAPGRQLQADKRQGRYILVYPSGMAQLNESAAAILALCDGTRTRDEIVAEILPRLPDDSRAADVREFLEAALRQGWIVEG